MLQIRRDVFETNSSSIHSLTIMEDDDFQDWKEGFKYYDFDRRMFYTFNEVQDKITQDGIDPDDEDDWEEWCFENNVLTHDQFQEKCANMYLDTYIQMHTLKNGDTIWGVGYYGEDK